jgi:hypothetical protein
MSSIDENEKVKIIIKHDYFDEEEKEKKKGLEEKIEELEKKNKHLIVENERLNKTLTEMFKMMNEWLKIGPIGDFQSNSEKIKQKIVSLFYRELRMKHVLPFSQYILQSLK